MKALIQFIFPTVKAVVAVVAFFIGLGWSAFVGVNMIVKAEGHDIRAEVKEIRAIDMSHIDKRFDRIEALIKERD